VDPLARRDALTLVGIRMAVWAGAALAFIWAPAIARTPYGDAYGPASNLLVWTFAQWDARWFVQIAEHGYEPVAGSAAFFPLYPALVHVVAFATGSTLVGGVLVSLLAGAVAAYVLARLARPLLGERIASDAVLYLALYPVGYVFTAVYPDPLFLALGAAAFLAAERGSPALAGVLAGLATGTRLIGLALVPALALLAWRRDRRWLSLAPLLLAPAAVGIYALYLDRVLGDPWAFASAQGGWNRSVSVLGPLAGLRDAVQAGGTGLGALAGVAPERFGHEQAVALWNLTHLGLLAVAVWLTVVAWRRVGAAYGLYSAATLLVVLSAPAEGIPLQSLPRFLLADFPLFLAAAALTAGRPRAHTLTVAGLATLGAAAAVAFSRGVWIA
jgi:hypothetical protein